VPHRSHHIADIAHHFLTGGEAAPAAAEPVWVVAASGPWPWSAPATLELARLMARDSGGPVCIAEDSAVVWSVRGHLAADDRALEVLEASAEAVHRAERLCWHLGPVAGERLDDLLAARRAPGGRLPGDGRNRRLVWCLGHAEAAGWSSLLGLGRMCGLLEPVGIDLVCMPERGAREGAPTSADAPAPEVLSLLGERAADACLRAVEVHLLTGAMSAAACGAVVAGLRRREVVAAAPFALDPPRIAP